MLSGKFGSMLLFGGWCVLFILLAASMYTLVCIWPWIIAYFKNLADKQLSEKVSGRVKDAIGKFEYVGQAILASESELFNKEILAILVDGKVESSEIQALAEKMANKILDVIKPEIGTFMKYISGDNVLKYIIEMVKKWMIDLAMKRLGKEVAVQIPFLPTNSTVCGTVSPIK